MTKANNTTTTANNAPHGWLLRYSDATYIRPATAAERRASLCAGDEGVIEVVVDGQQVACYVEEQFAHTPPTPVAMRRAHTRIRTMTYVTARAAAFCHTGVRTYKFMVDPSGVVRVWDSVAGHYTTCHSLSESAQRRIRTLAAASRNS